MKTLALVPGPRGEVRPLRDVAAEVRKYWGDRARLVELGAGKFEVVYVMGSGSDPWKAFCDAEMDRAAGAWGLASEIHALRGGES